MSRPEPPLDDPSRFEAVEAGQRYAEIDHRPHTAGGHPPDPNAGVVRASPPSGRALLASALVALATLACLALLLAVR